MRLTRKEKKLAIEQLSDYFQWDDFDKVAESQQLKNLAYNRYKKSRCHHYVTTYIKNGKVGLCLGCHEEMILPYPFADTDRAFHPPHWTGD